MRNTAIINLVTIRKNAENIKKNLEPNCKFCAVVKADGYGHGAVEVANAIYDIVDCYAVAILEEAIELRLAGIDKDILVLIPPFNSEIEKFVNYSLTATVDNKTAISMLNAEAKRQDKKVKAHIKFNAGMNRNGVDTIKELKSLLNFCKTQTWVDIEGLYSHFGAVEKKSLRNKTLKQFTLANEVIKGYNKKAVSHISASGGFLVGNMQFDMVRIGLLLYGYLPSGIKSKFLVNPALKIEISVIKKRILKKGQTAMYGAKKLKKNTKISLIRFGYADGLERRTIKGQVSNRCMDVTAIKGHFTRCEYSDVIALSKSYKTIPYEILTKIAIRANKKYIR